MLEGRPDGAPRATGAKRRSPSETTSTRRRPSPRRGGDSQRATPPSPAAVQGLPRSGRSEQTGFGVSFEPEDLRRLFWQAQRAVWRATEDRRQGWCRHVPRDQLVSIVKRAAVDGNDRAALEDLFCCGKAICPLCGPKIAIERAADIALAITEWYARGGRVGFSTWTLPHGRGDRLADLLQALTTAYAAAQGKRGKGQKALRARIRDQIAGEILKLETTVGPAHGWHPHRHALTFIKPGVSDQEAAQLDRDRFAAYAADLEAQGLKAHRKGHDFKVLELGEAHERVAGYVAKAAGHELAAAGTKRARGENRTPLEVLVDLGKLGRESDLQLWREYERAMKGKRLLRWSPGLRKLLLGDQLPELSDQEAAESTDGGSRLIAAVGRDTYKRICRWKGTPYALIRWAETYQDDAQARDLIARQLARHQLGHLEAGIGPPPDA